MSIVTPVWNDRIGGWQYMWASSRAFFVSSAMLRFRRLVFMSVVYNVGISGLEAYAMTKSDYDAIEACILKYARVLLKGAGCDTSKQEEVDTGTIKYKAMTNDDVWRRLGLTPCRLEVSIRKMKWMQNVAEHPHDNAQLLAALFCKADGSDAGENIDESSPPWLRQFKEDLELLSFVETGLDAWEAIDGKPRRIFADADVKDAYTRVDLDVIRAAFRTKQVLGHVGDLQQTP